MPNIQKSSLWCSRMLLHELLKGRPLASEEIKKDVTVGTKTLFQDKQKWVWKCPSSKLCIHIIPLKHPDLENGDLAWQAFVDTVDKVAREHPKQYVKQYFRGWAGGGWMSNLDFVSPYLHYLHQNGPSLALNPLSGEQISLNLYAPHQCKVFRRVYFRPRYLISREVQQGWYKHFPAVSAYQFIAYQLEDSSLIAVAGLSSLLSRVNLGCLMNALVFSMAFFFFSFWNCVSSLAVSSAVAVVGIGGVHPPVKWCCVVE